MSPGKPKIVSSSLTNGLQACYVPSAFPKTKIYDLVGLAPALLLQPNGTYQSTGEGYGLNSTAPNGGAQVACSTKLQLTSAMTLFWRGEVVAVGDIGNSCDLIGIDYDDAGNSPYWGMGSITTALLGDNDIGLTWNSGGTYTNSTTTMTPTATTLYSMVGTFLVGGNAVFYVNGSQQDSTVYGASAPNYGTTPMISIGAWSNATTYAFQGITEIACIWNRILSVSEIQTLSVNPFTFLSWPEDDLDWRSVGTNVVHFKKMSSALGTRVGTRQTR